MDSRSPAQHRDSRLRFDRFVLDLGRGTLFFDNDEVALRPKTFAVLCHLVENRGLLVSKEELFAAVWRDVSVTDDTLVQSIGELRRAMGSEGSRLIRTVPRRGYRFDAPVQADPPDDGHMISSAAKHDAGVASPPRPVGRSIHGRLALGAMLATLFVAAAVWTLIGVPPRVQAVFADRWVRQAPDLRPAIAVLPFRNLSDGDAREYFVDGLTQDVISALGRFSALTVMSWNAVLPYKNNAIGPREIGRSLAVRYQVEGSVRLTDEHAQVTVQLVGADGGVLWSSRFGRALGELHSLQDAIAAQIAATLAVRVSRVEQRRSIAKPAERLRAYDLELRARPALHRPERAGIAQAREFLRKAIEMDPDYAAAYSVLAETYYIAASMGWAESPATALERAEELASKALKISDSDVRARIILGRIHLFQKRYERAIAELDEAFAINPSDANGLAARGNILMWLGQTDAAIDSLEVAERVDPTLSAFDRNALSMAYYLKGQYEAAIRQAEMNVDKTGVGHFSHAIVAAASAMLDRFDDAERAVTVIRRTDPTFDAKGFGSKLLNASDLEHLRNGLRKAGLLGAAPADKYSPG